MTNAGLYTTDDRPIPLRGVEVTGEVLGGHAQVTVRQRYQNAEAKPVEAVYAFPLPSDATLTGFAMTCAGRRLDGVVREREKAFRDYDDALFAGHGAALLEQERPNVFTASVGNLLPGEETVVEITYVQRVPSDEGALRWSVPTLVAPRYIPGKPAGDRTADGWSEPTDRVPDADRITPRIGKVDYGLALDLVFDLGVPVEVESPSHAVDVQTEGNRTRVRFRQENVALDRDVVLLARGVSSEADGADGAAGRIESVIAHRPESGAGYLALTVVPDLAADGATVPPQDVVFVIDTSGSMSGASLPQAQAALRLCLRHLREGDRFNVIEFNSGWQGFAKAPVPFTQRALEEADRWVEALEATGGTEMLAPLTEAVKSAPDGVVVLLTDGQVGNEAAILKAVLEARGNRGNRGKARLYSFGIGTNVSDVLLRDLARRTGGAVEFIHPGERIDDKVVAQFARAIAPRVDDIKVSFEGVEIIEPAPEEPPALVDGEPWVMLGKIESGVRGRAIVTGSRAGKPFRLEVPVDLAAAGERPVVAKLWAQERVRVLTDAMRAVSDQRADRLKERIVALAVEHGLSTPYTSFLVVETRTGDRKATGVPETRVVPVNLPAGWTMFDKVRSLGYRPMTAVPRMAAAMSMPLGAATRDRSQLKKTKGGALFGRGRSLEDGPVKAPAPAGAPAYPVPFEAARPDPADPLRELLQRQLASGLWDDPAAPGDPFAQAQATTEALRELLRAGVDTAHSLYGAQVKKAVAALARLAQTLVARDRDLAERALGVAWLAASGRRTRREVEDAVAHEPALAGLRAQLGDERALRARLGA